MQIDEVRSLAQKIWDYHLMHQEMDKADVIFALGSHDIRVAERAAELYLQGYAPLIVFSGGFGVRASENDWTRPEAAVFAERAREIGVPEEALLLEEQSSNTGENILFTQQLLQEKGISPKKMILVQKPYMERRTFATFSKQWPEMDFLVTSFAIEFRQYPNEKISEERLINAMVGDLQRIKEYPAKGFQISQDIPEDVWEACEALITAGYNKRLINE